MSGAYHVVGEDGLVLGIDGGDQAQREAGESTEVASSETHIGNKE